MPSLSWNDIRQRAIAFAHEFKDTTEERADDRCYRKEKFDTEREREEYLFGLYEQLTTRSG